MWDRTQMVGDRGKVAQPTVVEQDPPPPVDIVLPQRPKPSRPRPEGQSATYRRDTSKRPRWTDAHNRPPKR